MTLSSTQQFGQTKIRYLSKFSNEMLELWYQPNHTFLMLERKGQLPQEPLYQPIQTGPEIRPSLANLVTDIENRGNPIYIRFANGNREIPSRGSENREL
ncbi:hypothetical protein ACOSQ4_025791 [Xanthoceras sorbifolium]